MENSLIDTVFSVFQNLGVFLLAFFARMIPLLIKPAFIGTLLFFTLMIWIGMSGDDREPAQSFAKAGFIAFIATVFIFAVISA